MIKVFDIDMVLLDFCCPSTSSTFWGCQFHSYVDRYFLSCLTKSRFYFLSLSDILQAMIALRGIDTIADYPLRMQQALAAHGRFER